MSDARYLVAVVGGATAGAEAAAMLAARGSVVVVFEQNARPYGKIEDGLPRWHDKLRHKEYTRVNNNLNRPGVHFVPLTRIGHDIEFPELVHEWGFTAVILATGAWRDRPLPVDGVDDYIDRGLLYQNAFVHWFNHYPEGDYHGPDYDPPDGTLVVGGGLASIDVAKVVQIETTRRALRVKGIEADTLHLEHVGIPAALGKHNLTWEDLGLRRCCLFYRRRIEDMPLAQIPDGADEATVRKFEATRRRILERAMAKYGFEVHPLHSPVDVLNKDDRLIGLCFRRTQIQQGRAVFANGDALERHAPLVISSIGSTPEAMPGIESAGEYYRFSDPELGRVAGYENVFGAGNAVTGKGNIVASRRHSILVGNHLIEQFLGLAEDGAHDAEADLLDSITDPVEDAVSRLADWIGSRPPVSAAHVDSILTRVRERQHAIGYTGSYDDWIARVRPSGGP